MEMLNDPDKQKAKKVMKAMLQMKKMDVRELERTYGE
jgi:predicted 3-demethylubiquinone-9 3-methyltransferase (glyoxalase superfamily)